MDDIEELLELALVLSAEREKGFTIYNREKELYEVHKNQIVRFLDGKDNITSFSQINAERFLEWYRQQGPIVQSDILHNITKYIRGDSNDGM